MQVNYTKSLPNNFALKSPIISSSRPFPNIETPHNKKKMKLVIKVMWCKGLTAFNFFQKLKVYTIVSIKSDNKILKLTHHQKQQQKTPVDEEGSGNPEWHHPMTFDISRLESIPSSFDDLLLVFKFRHDQLVGFKTVGEVQVPLRRLIEQATNENVKFVSYEVRNPEGKHNGVLDFCFEVIRNDDYRHHHQHHHHRHNSKYVDRRHDAHTDTDTATSASSDKNLSECHRTPLVQQFSSNPEKIMYPKIDLEDLSDIIPTYLSPISPNISHYPTPLTVYPPPAEIQCSLPPPIPTHFLPPPPPYVVYPSIQYGYPPYGHPHCGYYQHG